MSWFQSEIDCVRQWGLEEQWGHEQGLLCALPPLQVGSVVSWFQSEIDCVRQWGLGPHEDQSVEMVLI